MTRQSNKLDALKGTTPATGIADESANAGPIFVVRSTFADPGDRYEHTGPAIVQAGERFVAILPGLNIFDEGTDLDTSGDGMARTDADLAGFTGSGSMRELAEKTDQPRALEHLLAHAQNKPFTGPGRRDPELIALLQNRLSIASVQSQLNVGDLHTQAAAQSMVSQSRAG